MADFQRLGTDINESLVTPQYAADMDSRELAARQALKEMWGGMQAEEQAQAEEQKQKNTGPEGMELPDLGLFQGDMERFNKPFEGAVDLAMTAMQSVTNATVGTLESLITGDIEGAGKRAYEEFTKTWSKDYDESTAPAMQVTRNYLVKDEEGQIRADGDVYLYGKLF